jgi:acyl-CoA reductase-like NAD-dependent aldehyde dehydrogenase
MTTSDEPGATGEAIREATAEEVAAAVERGRAAFATWGRTTVRERVERLARLSAALIDDMDGVVDAISRATGKLRLDALTADVMTCAEALCYTVEHAERVLAPERRPAPLLFGLSRFHVEYAPLGVVAVLSPWNYPLQLALLPMVSALAAGDCVVLKPSEVTPFVGPLILALCARAGLADGVVQVVQGGPSVGRALIAARPDKVFFTGSVATGKKVMAAAAEHLIPVELELGGKDPMMVFADANLERAVAGAVWGAFTNAGQACIAVERVYVERPIYERFVAAATEATLRLRVGAGDGADVGPIINPAQIAVIDAHLDDALARGARLTTPRRRDGRLYHPVVLRDVDHSMRVMTEETFGPVMPVMPFDTEADAVALANDSIYGLNASVWTRDLERGRRVARAVVAGSCAVNDVLKNASNPYMPFGGERQSGLGRYHGPEGLRAFASQRSIMVNAGRARSEPNWFPYTPTAHAAVRAMIHLLHDGRPLATRARALAAELRRR